MLTGRLTLSRTSLDCMPSSEERERLSWDGEVSLLELAFEISSIQSIQHKKS